MPGESGLWLPPRESITSLPHTASLVRRIEVFSQLGPTDVHFAPTADIGGGSRYVTVVYCLRL